MTGRPLMQSRLLMNCHPERSEGPIHFARTALLSSEMITRSADYVEYCRDTARRLRNLQDLALRGKNKQTLTRRVQERIVREVALTGDDDIVDIGCGDGTLLLLAKNAGVRNATGLH